MLRWGFQSIRNKVKVGTDLTGNEYYTIKAILSGKMRRIIRFKDDVLRPLNEVPSPWRQWLYFRRDDIPNVSELHAEEARIKLIQQRSKEVNKAYAKLREEEQLERRMQDTISPLYEHEKPKDQQIKPSLDVILKQRGLDTESIEKTLQSTQTTNGTRDPTLPPQQIPSPSKTLADDTNDEWKNSRHRKKSWMKKT